MNKKKLNILVDDYFNNDYLELLKLKYDIENVYTWNDVRENIYKIKIDLIVFTGGADVSPEYYGENKGQYTSIDKKRDKVEYDMFQSFYMTPKVGFCRGSQYLTVLNSGKLVQHVTGHTSPHTCTYRFNEGQQLNTFTISSTHHQMMYPYNLNKDKYEIIAWSEYFKSNTYLNGDNKEIDLPTDFLEPEIVHYKESNSLAIQGHPEFSSVDNNVKILILKIIDKYLFNNENR